MRKKTQQKIMVIFIILIFGMSSLAFVSFNVPSTAAEQQSDISGFVVEGDVNPDTESRYMEAGFTWIKYFYNIDSEINGYVESIPKLLLTTNNQVQIIVQKFPGDEEKIFISGPKGEDEIYNLTEENIFSSLCNIVLVTPVECGLNKFLQEDISTEKNTTNSSS